MVNPIMTNMTIIREGHYISKSSSGSGSSSGLGDSKEVIRIKQARNPQNGKMEWADVSNPDARGNFKFYRDDQIINDFEYLEGQQASEDIPYSDSASSIYNEKPNIGDLSTLTRPSVTHSTESNDDQDTPVIIKESTNDVSHNASNNVVKEVVKEVVREVKEPLEKSILNKCRIDDKQHITINFDIELGYNLKKLSDLIQTLDLDTNKIINMMSDEINISMSLAKSKIIEELIKGVKINHPSSENKNKLNKDIVVLSTIKDDEIKSDLESINSFLKTI